MEKLKYIKEHLLYKTQWDYINASIYHEESNQWRDKIERLEVELKTLKDANDTMKNQFMDQTEILSMQKVHTEKLRDENLDLLDRYKQVLEQNSQFKREIWDLKIEIERTIKKTNFEKKPTESLYNELENYQKRILKERGRLTHVIEKNIGLKDRNKFLKQELSLQKDKNRTLEKQIMSYVKKVGNLSHEASINKCNYKSMAASQQQLKHSVEKLKKENKSLKTMGEQSA